LVDSGSDFTIISNGLASRLSVESRPASVTCTNAEGNFLSTIKRRAKIQLIICGCSFDADVLIGDIVYDMIVGGNILKFWEYYIVSNSSTPPSISFGPILSSVMKNTRVDSITDSVPTVNSVQSNSPDLSNYESNAIVSRQFDDSSEMKESQLIPGVICQESPFYVKLTAEDFVAERIDSKWVMSFKFKSTPPPFNTQCPVQYTQRDLTDAQKMKLRQELKLWQENGYIKELTANDSIKYIVPVFGVVSEHKRTEIRPVLDLRKFNSFCIDSKGFKESHNCRDSVRVWRQHNRGAVIDLKKAFMNVFLHESLQSFITIGVPVDPDNKDCIKYFKMTRMAFGLAAAPRALNAILKFILDGRIQYHSYFDDLLIKDPDDIPKLIEILNANGFAINSPILINSPTPITVLGYSIFKGEWKRRPNVKIESFLKG
jgi:hypothetical protein